MLESTPPSREDAKGLPLEFFQYPRRRRDSTDSNSSWGSDIANVGCKCVSHDDDELEVAGWLLHSNEPDWAIRPCPPPSSPESKPSCPPFCIHDAPGPLFLHLLFAVLVYWGLIPNYPIYPRPSISKPTVAPPPLKKLPLHNYLGKRDPAIRPDGTRMRFGESEAYYLVDDTEYVISPTPGTDEEELRLIMSNDFSDEKLDTHTRDLLRIYRVPPLSMITFGYAVRKRGLVGHAVRKPFDSFDTISVVRQSYVSWDFTKDQHWMLIGRDSQAINAVLKRTDRRKPPFITRSTHLFLKVAYKIFAPWLPTWILY